MNYLKFYNGGNVIKYLDEGGYITQLDNIINNTNDFDTYQQAFRLKVGAQRGFGQQFDYNGNPTSVSESDVRSFIDSQIQTTPAESDLTDDDITRMRNQQVTALDPLAGMKAPGKIVADTNTLKLGANGLPTGGITVKEVVENGQILNSKTTPLTGTPAAKAPINKTFANYATAAAGTVAGLVGGQPAADSVNMVSTVAQNPAMAGTDAGKAAMGLGVISAAGNILDKQLMGDKNFGSQSQAIDAVVHGTSSALMKSGNPYAMLAGAALEAGNFLTKAGGQTVQGFDVDINSSGYGNMGHKESSSSRDFGAMLGLGGLNAAATQRKLKQRNEEAQMALKASNVADTIKFEQEARMNSVDDVIQQNEIALQGGIDTSLLAAKHGAKLERKITWDDILIDTKPEVVKAQNGAKLEEVQVSEEKNIIPEGALHKNKNGLDLEITKKGIPVITVKDDSAETFEDIKEQEDTLVQHAEVEESEIIFNKELTDYIENTRKKWHESEDPELALEVGKRLVKEILTNTDDNTDLITKMEEQV